MENVWSYHVHKVTLETENAKIRDKSAILIFLPFLNLSENWLLAAWRRRRRTSIAIAHLFKLKNKRRDESVWHSNVLLMGKSAVAQLGLIK